MVCDVIDSLKATDDIRLSIEQDIIKRVKELTDAFKV